MKKRLKASKVKAQIKALKVLQKEVKELKKRLKMTELSRDMMYKVALTFDF
jgi:hypothetical protein